MSEQQADVAAEVPAVMASLRVGRPVQRHSSRVKFRGQWLTVTGEETPGLVVWGWLMFLSGLLHAAAETRGPDCPPEPQFCCRPHRNQTVHPHRKLLKYSLSGRSYEICFPLILNISSHKQQIFRQRQQQTHVDHQHSQFLLLWFGFRGVSVLDKLLKVCRWEEKHLQLQNRSGCYFLNSDGITSLMSFSIKR